MYFSSNIKFLRKRRGRTQDDVASDADTDGFVDEATGVSSGEADANGFTYQYLKESDTYRLTKGTDTENVIIPYEYIE